MISLSDLGPTGRELKATCRRFLADESGASLLLVAAVLVPLLGFAGLGTDAARGYMVKARLGDALDAAVLAGAHVIEPADIQAEIQKYFDANFPPGFMGATVTLSPVQVSGPDDELINITVQESYFWAVVLNGFAEVFGHANAIGATVVEELHHHHIAVRIA